MKGERCQEKDAKEKDAKEKDAKEKDAKEKDAKEKDAKEKDARHTVHYICFKSLITKTRGLPTFESEYGVSQLSP